MIMHQLDARVRRIIRDLKSMSVRRHIPIENIEARLKGEQDFKPFTNGSEMACAYGDNWQDFRFTVAVPDDFAGVPTLSMRSGREGQWEATNPQAVVWVNGKIEQSFDTRHTELELDEKSEAGKKYDILVEAYARRDDDRTPPRMSLYIDDVDDEVRQLVYDLSVPHEAALMMPEDSRARERTLYALSDCVNLLDLRKPHSAEFAKSIQAARAFLKENYYDKLAAEKPVATADCIGHTHIDVAWLWDLYQTRHKAVRTFATMLKLMDKYPEFKFMSSQPQLYQFVKEDQPELFERVRQAVKRGQWEAEGGMWVEADCNLSGGEALVRQLLYGNEFFMNEFGKRSRILWLPDVFGYSAALPQILKKSGIDYFMTSKLSWSEYNKSPYDTFMWKGIDGSCVLTHFTPSRDYGSENMPADLRNFTTYNAMLSPNQVKGGWQRFQQKGLDDHFLVTFGFGDGGGGSTDWMIENARRMENPVAECPAVRQIPALEFFKELDSRVGNDRCLPKWAGELYLEYHRGTYTSQARNKRNNRKLEIALREAELWLARAANERGLEYPQDELREIWRQMLTLQFHDILPGSSIRKVYEDSNAIYADLFARLEKLNDSAVKALTRDSEGDIVFLNSLSHSRDDVCWFKAEPGVCAIRNKNGERFPAQRVGDEYVAFVKGLTPMGLTAMWLEYGSENEASITLSAEGFETQHFAGEFDKDMRISRLYDKRADREVCASGKALNRLVVYENRPHNYDAWDINVYYDEHGWEVENPLSVRVKYIGCVLGALEVSYKTGESTIEQEIIVYADIPRIDFRTKADWKEEQAVLKARFPVDVFGTSAQFDIQYGNVTRQIHKNTSWDAARFEVCAHKWADISEPDYGAALMNDCKYGYTADENGLALTLIKSSSDPDPKADRETHEFTYSLYPHTGDWRRANVPDNAYMLNMPVTALKAGGGSADIGGYARVDAPNVIVESVKAALHGSGTIIKLYECFGARTRAKLFIRENASEILHTSLMEDDLGSAAFTRANGGCEVSLELKPYEIVTLRVK